MAYFELALFHNFGIARASCFPYIEPTQNYTNSVLNLMGFPNVEGDVPQSHPEQYTS